MATDWSEVALLVGIVVPSVILHEVAHGVTALHFGDDTAKRAGRLTLNPVAHVDAFGTLLLPLMLAASGIGVIGYAKPVPVDIRRLRRPRDHAVLVSLAGPATNLLVALAAAVVVRIVGGVFWTGSDFVLVSGGFREVAFYAGFLNVLLALFNLLPLPPLDGSAVVERLLPAAWWPAWLRFRRYSFGIFLVAFLVLGLGRLVVDPALALWALLAT